MKIFIQRGDENKAAKTRRRNRGRLAFTSFCIIFAGVAAFSAVGLTNFTRAAAGYPNTMQGMTKKYCKSMTVYDGTNPSAIITLNDTRGANQQYQVAKLVDGNCWMLDNLKLADFTATAADTDLNDISSFTIPALDTTKGDSEDVPFVYGPVPNDTGAGATNYGYLYNWSAATAGETSVVKSEGDSRNNLAPNSICPKGWRLPKGDEYAHPDNEFDQLNAIMAGYSSNQDPLYQAGRYNISASNWQYTGAFKGVLSGEWNHFTSRFEGQGKTGKLWSAKPSWAGPDLAYLVIFDTSIYPADTYAGRYRNSGHAIRCVVSDNAVSVPVANANGNKTPPAQSKTPVHIKNLSSPKTGVGHIS
jgi:uncharacterized protein (TIGR02145 family)